MQWPPWTSSNPSTPSKSTSKWADNLNATDWSHYLEPRNIISTIILTSAVLGTRHIYKYYLRRIPGTASIGQGMYRKRSLFGKVTSVGDGDGFHLFHTPGGRLAGWGWARGVPTKAGGRRGRLTGRTIGIRIAGVDAPEGAHFGKPGQPHATEALEWLRGYILNRRVRCYIYRRDQYDRVVAAVYVRRWLRRKNVGLEMLKAGMATVYEGKTGSEFGGLEEEYRKAERRAREQKRGIWGQSEKAFVSPREFKRAVKEGDGVVVVGRKKVVEGEGVVGRMLRWLRLRK